MIEPLPLPDVDEEPPAGPNLESDPDFREMQLAAKGKVDSQFGEAEPPDWKEVARFATALVARTRDLRVFVQLAIARLNLDDLPGFAAVLLATRQVIETGWADVHPQLDPEDDNDPVMRANSLADLSNGRVVRALREVTLASPPREQKLRWVDVEIAHGTVEAEEGHARRSEAEMLGAFQKTPRETLILRREAAQTIAAELAAIPKAFEAQTGGNDGPDFKDLPKVAQGIAAELVRQEAMTEEAAPADAAEDEGEAPASGAGRGRDAGRSFTSIRGIAHLTTREDALHALTLAAAYFRTNEPSSPVPLLIDRAARLVPLPFLEILRDLAPDGLMQAQLIAGATDN